jgi:hypothetical protein
MKKYRTGAYSKENDPEIARLKRQSAADRDKRKPQPLNPEFMKDIVGRLGMSRPVTRGRTKTYIA